MHEKIGDGHLLRRQTSTSLDDIQKQKTENIVGASPDEKENFPWVAEVREKAVTVKSKTALLMAAPASSEFLRVLQEIE